MFRTILPTFLFPVLAAAFLGAPPASAQEQEPDALGRVSATMLRPGDQIALTFLRERELSATITVNERGEAVFPRLGTLHVTDLSIARLQDSLRTRYAEYLRSPELEIAVLRRIAVIGEVRAPNVYMVDPTTTLREAIARAGGLTDIGSRGRVSVIRGSQKIPVKNWDRETGQSFPLQSGDQISVGRKNWFVINALSTISTAVLVSSLIITIHDRSK